MSELRELIDGRETFALESTLSGQTYAVQHAFMIPNKETSGNAINKTAQLVQGAHLIELNNKDFRTTKLGHQLAEAMAERS